MILIEGNTAGALGAMFAGVTVVRLVSDHAVVVAARDADRVHEEAPDRQGDGKATYAIVQAEDEIASIGMVLGAGWAGARAMTSTSGPGISLMSEFAGLAYYAEVPGVVFDIQRVGPSTGLPTRTAQGDILTTALLSHGDTKQILLIPASVEECYTMAMDAFDLAERFQTLVFVMSDLDLGMNMWMSTPFTYPETPLDRGKVLDAETRRSGSASGDATRTSTATAFPYRTIPGNGMPAYFTRGSGHNERGSTASAPTTTNNVDRLARKHETAKQFVPAPIVEDGRGRGRHHRLRHQPLGDRREPRSARGARSASRPPTCGSGRIRSRPRSRRSSRATRASTWSSRTATRRCSALMRIELPPRARPTTCAACCTTTACRSTRGR